MKMGCPLFPQAVIREPAVSLQIAIRLHGLVTHREALTDSTLDHPAPRALSNECC